MDTQCYLIRHLKKGVLTDRVYLEKPTMKMLEDVCGVEDVKNNLVRVITSLVVSSRKDILDKLDKVEEKVQPTLQKDKVDKVFKIVMSGAGTVKNPG